MQHHRLEGQATPADAERMAAVVARLPVDFVEMSPGDAVMPLKTVLAQNTAVSVHMLHEIFTLTDSNLPVCVIGAALLPLQFASPLSAKHVDEATLEPNMLLQRNV